MKRLLYRSAPHAMRWLAVVAVQRMSLLGVAMLSSACGFQISALGGDDGGVMGDGDAGEPIPDVRSTACQWTRPPLHFDPCDAPDPAGSLSLTMVGIYTYDTGSGVLTAPSGTTSTPSSAMVAQISQMVRVLSISELDLGASSTLRVTGPLPLIIASTSSIMVQGTIDASSNTPTGNGAGANAAACSANAATMGASLASGGGGGGGGGFRGNGGDGGSASVATKGLKGTAIALPDELRGGCAGADGGDGGATSTPGAGGSGGGAIEIAARGSVTISGQIHAGGARGDRGTQSSDVTTQLHGGGGGGGGSGGMIYIDTPMLTLTGAILASNGGGGGEGGDNNQDGNPGEDGLLSSTAASKGSGRANDGGDGGDGAADSTLDGSSAQDNNSGGGGGGGVGFIVFRVDTLQLSGTVSPMHQTQP